MGGVQDSAQDAPTFCPITNFSYFFFGAEIDIVLAASQIFRCDLSSLCGLVAVERGIDENLYPSLVDLPVRSTILI